MLLARRSLYAPSNNGLHCAPIGTGIHNEQETRRWPRYVTSLPPPLQRLISMYSTHQRSRAIMMISGFCTFAAAVSRRYRLSIVLGVETL